MRQVELVRIEQGDRAALYEWFYPLSVTALGSARYSASTNRALRDLAIALEDP